jgi:hypothetical protein
MPTKINDVIDAIESALLDAVHQDDDDVLFFASYLHGHYDLAVVQTLAQPQPEAGMLDHFMQMSLGDAFAQGELTEPEQTAVLTMWQELFSLHQT